MQLNKGKILGYLLLTASLAVIIFLSIQMEEEDNSGISSIVLKGNSHLSTEDYLKYTRLDSKDNFRYLTVNIIKDRFEKHPYIDFASVKREPNNIIYVNIVEKKFDAVVTQWGKSFFITGEYTLIPFYFGTRNVDYPIISGISRTDTLKPFFSVRKDLEIKDAFRVMAVAELIDKNLYSNLSEIICSGERGMQIQFINLDFPVILGKGEEIKKMVYFGKMWAYFDGKLNNDIVEYIDLRYDKHIFLGFNREQIEGQSS